MLSDTIAAISTALGEAAISVVRMSGPQALQVAEKAFKLPPKLTPRLAHLVHAVDAGGTAFDHGLLLHFKGPASYTGEDVIEFHGHGGVLVTQRVLERLLACGARAAEPGEFTQRAFLNGKMDLTQAEAVMDLIHAQSTLALRAANEQLGGAIGREAQAMQQEIIPVLAHIEAYIDFPEEDISPETGADLLKRIDAVLLRAEKLIATSEQGRILRHGARTVISGAPNVGKSSLLNLLLGFERAIVSPTAGTTRDTIEEIIQVHGIPLRLVDTAGLRDSTDDIERVGIQRTERELDRADLVIEVVDGSDAGTSILRSTAKDEPARNPRFSLPPELARRRLLVLNKADLGLHADWKSDPHAIPLSCVTGEGIEALRDAIRAIIANAGPLAADHPVAINARHKAAFERSADRLRAARSALEANEAPEFIALEIREALHALGDVIGQVDVERILDVIFSTFCIGK
ncbi:MAG: tRNA uridine-5-carboxymethylaminomethyl(34) synthesis GTPase MnmE [Prosthecobacter sp.]|jgi:tRNA modification GTPase|uniref:tRNA uridine-5-carboxymethylaminomethyl(34) synthesis GTPase MnmE n=1 Tax=Prosthecobacter sp. TaxID=1965333 RepID=UPI0019D94FD5|nr:tRNA uridine-5-carboxymethylaminomethyl(34) synthesis GTPase MnmE [Prosthecobacter sp.]MBE2281896.1 tRNA uridine-5-carboxymethylaminomethyl(34) synthesis GTPase MnmE [Prosthecobacter sp.]